MNKYNDQPAKAEIVLQAKNPIDYARKTQPFREALTQAAQLRDEELNLVPGSTLVQLARNLLDAGLAGQAQALAQLADRWDGKPGAEITLPAGAELAAGFVLRGPPMPRDYEHWAREYAPKALLHEQNDG